MTKNTEKNYNPNPLLYFRQTTSREVNMAKHKMLEATALPEKETARLTIPVNLEQLELLDIIALSESTLEDTKSRLDEKYFKGFINLLRSIDPTMNYLFGLTVAGSQDIRVYDKFFSAVNKHIKTCVDRYKIKELIAKSNKLVNDLQEDSYDIIGLINRTCKANDMLLVNCIIEVFVRSYVSQKLKQFSQHVHEILKAMIEDIRNYILGHHQVDEILRYYDKNQAKLLESRDINHFDLIWKIQYTASCYPLGQETRIAVAIIKILRSLDPDKYKQTTSQAMHNTVERLLKTSELINIKTLLKRHGEYVWGKDTVTLTGDRSKDVFETAKDIKFAVHKLVAIAESILDEELVSFPPKKKSEPQVAQISRVVVLGDSISAGPPQEGSRSIYGGIAIVDDGTIQTIPKDGDTYGFVEQLGRLISANYINTGMVGITIDMFTEEFLINGPFASHDFSNDLVIIELGINDYGHYNLEYIADTLTEMIRILKTKKAKEIVLMGFSHEPDAPPTNIEILYTNIAKDEGITLIPNMFKGIKGREEFYIFKNLDPEEKAELESRIISLDWERNVLQELGLLPEQSKKRQTTEKEKSTMTTFIDHLHPNGLGHVVIAANALKYLKPLFNKYGIYVSL